jgi:hypothetical protein
MEEVSMRSFASAIDEPMRFQIGDKLPNLTGHTDNITEVKTSKQRGASVNLGEGGSLNQRKQVKPLVLFRHRFNLPVDHCPRSVVWLSACHAGAFATAGRRRVASGLVVRSLSRLT